MDWRFTTNFILLLLATALSTRLAYYAWRRRPATGTTLFTLLMLAMTQWVLAYTLEITSISLANKLIWAKYQYIGIVILPVAWLLFVSEFTGKNSWITRRNIFLLSIIPICTFFLVTTNEMHRWFWRQATLDFSPFGFPTLNLEYGFWFWIHTFFSYGCLVVASSGLISSWRREVAAGYRWQTIALLFGLLLPWVGNALYVASLGSQELSAFLFLISGIILVQFTLRFRLFDIAPLAYRTIVNSMTDGIIVLDKQNRIADVNRVAERIVGRPADNLLGKSLEVIWPNLAAIFSEAIEESVEINFGAPEAPSFYEVSASPLQDWRHKPRGYLLALHDITRRKELENMREDMIQTMVHELRDPLSNSLFALEMLRGDLSDVDLPEGDQILELTFAQTMKTLQLIDKILEIGRLKNGVNMVITRTPIFLQDLIKKVISAHSLRLPEKQLKISYDVPETLPYAWADVGLVERVLGHLMDNSIKYSPVGGNIHVEAAMIGANGNSESPRVMISVSDEGPGIPDDFQEKIFDKFVTGSEKWSGTGLGLAFCKMAIKAHGESIWVESDQESGSQFIFSLPVSLEPALVLEPA